MLSNSELYRIWRGRLLQLAPDDCQSRLVNMLLLVVGLYKAESVHLSKVARKLPLRAKKLSLDKRLRRFLNNPQVRVREWYLPVAVALLKSASSAGQVHLIIDSSTVGFGHKLLMVAIAYRRRALPLSWTWVPHTGRSTNGKQLALLSYVHSLVPQGVQVSLVGDGEFNHVLVMTQLDAWGWDYALKQRKSERFLPRGMLTMYRLDRQKLEPGEKWWLGRVNLTFQYFYITNLVMYRAPGAAKTWYLATNLPSARGAILLYQRRMWIEEMFGDMKGHGFDLEATYLRHFLRLSRLTLAVCLVYLWVVATGEHVLSDGLANEIDRTDRRDLSIFRLGWDFIERRLALDDPIPANFIPALVQ